MKSCNHENIIKLYGACFRDDDLECLVLEYLEKGDLLNYLIKANKSKEVIL